MSLKEFELVKDLGKGSFGAVSLVKRRADGLLYALKRVNIGEMGAKEKENALNEVRLLASISSKQIIAYKEAFFDDTSQTLNIIMEYADDEDLDKKIKEKYRNNKHFNEDEIWFYAIQILKGLKSLHDKNIMHRDLKSANIFLTKEGRVKIGDLNVGKLIKDNKLAITQTGTPYYASPEVWADLPYDYKADLWSFGCIIYEMCCWKTPFRAKNLPELFETVTKGEYKPIPETYSSNLSQLIKLLLKVNPEHRLDCNGVFELSFVKEKIAQFQKKLNMHKNEDFDEKAEFVNTIKVPTNLSEINNALPKTKYESPTMKEDKSSGNLSNMKQNMNKINEAGNEGYKPTIKQNHNSHNYNLQGQQAQQAQNNINHSNIREIKKLVKDMVGESDPPENYIKPNNKGKSSDRSKPLVLKKTNSSTTMDNKSNSNTNNIKNKGNISSSGNNSAVNENNNGRKVTQIDHSKDIKSINAITAVTPTKKINQPINQGNYIKKNNSNVILTTQGNYNHHSAKASNPNIDLSSRKISYQYDKKVQINSMNNLDSNIRSKTPIDIVSKAGSNINKNLNTIGNGPSTGKNINRVVNNQLSKNYVATKNYEINNNGLITNNNHYTINQENLKGNSRPVSGIVISPIISNKNSNNNSKPLNRPISSKYPQPGNSTNANSYVSSPQPLLVKGVKDGLKITKISSPSTGSKERLYINKHYSNIIKNEEKISPLKTLGNSSNTNSQRNICGPNSAGKNIPIRPTAVSTNNPIKMKSVIQRK